MRHQIPVILGGMGLIAGIAAAKSPCGNTRVAALLYLICGVFFLWALIAAWYEGLPKPHIVIVGYGRTGTGQVDGLLIANDGEPAYNISPPPSIPFGGQSRIVFDDPIITHLTKEHGARCLPVEVESNLGGGAVNGLNHDMAMRGIHELPVKFFYADGRSPKQWRRYVTIGKLQLIHGHVVGVFVKQKMRWLSVLRRD
jgi:hypothetical protein